MKKNKGSVRKSGGRWAMAFALGLALTWIPPCMANGIDDKIVYDSEGSGAGRITIEGTSTLHDWEVGGDTIVGRITLDETAADMEAAWLDAAEALSAQVEIPVRSLESGRRRMDREMFSALNASEYPTITYRLTAMERMPEEHTVPEDDHDEGTVHLLANGELTISGQTRTVTFPVTIAARNGSLKIQGQAALTMTDFGVEPPRLMLGALRTGDEITVQFNWAPERLNEK